jgi:hypothetical protein
MSREGSVHDNAYDFLILKYNFIPGVFLLESLEGYPTRKCILPKLHTKHQKRKKALPLVHVALSLYCITVTVLIVEKRCGESTITWPQGLIDWPPH